MYCIHFTGWVIWSLTIPAHTAGMTKSVMALLSQGWLKSKGILDLGFTALVVIYHTSPKYQCLANIYFLYFASFSMKSCFGWIYCPKVSHLGSLVLGRSLCISIP